MKGPMKAYTGKSLIFMLMLSTALAVSGTARDEKTGTPDSQTPSRPAQLQADTSSVVDNNDIAKDDQSQRHFNWKNEYILSECVNDDGRVNYELLRRKKPALYALLYDYSDLTREEYETWSKPDQIAFWINAYNIQTLKILSQNYPIESSRFLRLIWGPYSIRHIDREIDGIERQKFIIMDEEFTLREIERQILRDQFNEPRACFALCRGTKGSPPLRPEPYIAEKIDHQLDDQVSRYLASCAALQLEKHAGRVYLSVLFQPNWWGQAFIDKYGIDRKFKDHEPSVRAVLNFLTNYTAPDITSYLQTGIYSVDYISYDWTINDTNVNAR